MVGCGAGARAWCTWWLVDGAGVGRTADRPGAIQASTTADKGQAERAYTGRGYGQAVREQASAGAVAVGWSAGRIWG